MRIHLPVVAVLFSVTAVTQIVALECDYGACIFGPAHPDLAPDLDARIKMHLVAGKTAEQIAAIEGGGSLLRPAVEAWANSHRAAIVPDAKRLKYRGSRLLGSLWLHFIEPSVKMGGVCVGTDKLGHMFQQGWECYRIAVLDGKGEETARRYSEWLEGAKPRETFTDKEAYFRSLPSGRIAGYGGFGRNIDGIISNADVAANLAGLRFYQDIAAGKFKSITGYVTSSLCEKINLNDYTPAMAALVRENGRL